MTGRVLYAEAEGLAEKASEMGMDDVSARLAAMIKSASTGTELLMGVRALLLEDLPRFEDAPGLRDDAVSLIEGINEALR